MRIVLITQEEPVFLAGNISYLLDHMPMHSSIVACALLDPSPFGKRQKLTGKLRTTLAVFGIGFLLRYGWLHAVNRWVAGRSVARACAKRGIPVIHVTGSINDCGNLSRIALHQPDLLVSIAGNQIFRRELFTLAPRGCLNLHTALLPRYRGLMPSFWVLKNEEKETGVSVFFVDEGIDSGPILVQERMEIGGRSQYELIRESKHLGMNALLKAFDKLEAGEEPRIPNDDAGKTYFKFPTRADVLEFRRKGKRFF